MALGATGIAALAAQWAWKRDYGVNEWNPALFAALMAALLLSVALSLWLLLDRLQAWRTGRWSSATFLPYRVAGYVLVLGALLVVTAFQPFHKYFLLLNLGVQMGVLSAALLLVFRAPNLLSKRLARGLDRVLLMLCLSALAIEGGVRALRPLTEAPLFDHGNVRPEANLERNRFEARRLFLGTPCDSRGFHEIERELGPGERLVCAVGDSFSVGIVPHYFHYTTVAERSLEEVEVDNLGVIGVGPLEYNLMLEQEAVPKEPDLVLYAVFVGNDVLDTVYSRTDFRWARWFYDREFMLSVQVFKRLRIVSKEREEGNLEDDTWQDQRLVDATPEALIQRYPWTQDPRLERASFTPEAFLEIEAARASQICDPAQPELYDDFFDAVARAMEIVAPVPFAVLLIPDEFQVEDEVWQKTLEHPACALPLDRDLPQRRIRAWLEPRGVPTLDLLPILRAVPALADGNRHLYSLRDTHFNTRGNRVAGEALAEFLAELLE